MNQSSCLTLVPAAGERSKQSGSQGLRCVLKPLPCTFPHADEEGTVHLEIRTGDAEDRGMVLKDPTRLDSRRSRYLVEQSREDAKHALDLRVMRPVDYRFAFVCSVP